MCGRRRRSTDADYASVPTTPRRIFAACPHEAGRGPPDASARTKARGPRQAAAASRRRSRLRHCCCFVAIAVNFANVVARYVFLASIYWADEVMVFLAIWSIFLAAAAVTYDGRHLTMDLFSARLSPRWRPRAQAFVAAVCFATFVLMAWQSFEVVRMLARNDQTLDRGRHAHGRPARGAARGICALRRRVVCRSLFAGPRSSRMSSKISSGGPASVAHLTFLPALPRLRIRGAELRNRDTRENRRWR